MAKILQNTLVIIKLLANLYIKNDVAKITKK